MKSSRFVSFPGKSEEAPMGMEGQDLAGKEKSRESHNATSYMRKGAETDCGEGLRVNGFPGYHCLDESTTCLSSLLL